MTTKTQHLIIALFATIALVMTAQPSHAGEARPLPAYAKPCKYEDSSVRCTWDAKHMGNGRGKSFVVLKGGRVKYVSHKRAHTLITRWREAHADYTNV